MGTHIYSKYPPDCSFNGKRVLNIGCGFAQYKIPNVVNVDAFDVCKPDLVWDLNKAPMPLEDESFDHIIANHILEHLPNWWACFNDCARMLKVGGVLEVWVPGSGSDSIHGYRDHINEINGCSFYGVFGTYRAGGNAWAAEQAVCPANRLKNTTKYSNPEPYWWFAWAPLAVKSWMAVHLRNVVSENGYIFKKVTEQEHQKEMQVFNERLKNNRLIPLPQVRQPSLSGSN